MDTAVVADGELNPILFSTYEHAGQEIVSETTHRGTTNFTYDSSGRLIQSKSPNGATTEYAYDTWGNRVATVETASPPVSTSYEYTPQKRLARVLREGSEVEYFDYDQAGRVTSIESSGVPPVHKTLVYGPRGLLRRFVIEGESTTEYLYDESNRRIYKGYATSECRLEFRYVYGGTDFLGKRLLSENIRVMSLPGESLLYEGSRDYIWQSDELTAINETVGYVAPNFSCREGIRSSRAGSLKYHSGNFTQGFSSPTAWGFLINSVAENATLRQVVPATGAVVSFAYAQTILDFPASQGFNLSVDVTVRKWTGNVGSFELIVNDPSGVGSISVGCNRDFESSTATSVTRCGNFESIVADIVGRTLTFKMKYSNGQLITEIPQLGVATERTVTFDRAQIGMLGVVVNPGEMELEWSSLVTDFPFEGYVGEGPPLEFLGDVFDGFTQTFGSSILTFRGVIWEVPISIGTSGIPRLVQVPATQQALLTLDGTTPINAALVKFQAEGVDAKLTLYLTTQTGSEFVRNQASGDQLVAFINNIFVPQGEFKDYRWGLPEHSAGLPRRNETFYVHSDARLVPIALTDREGKVVWERNVDPFGRTSDFRIPIVLKGQYADFESGFHYNLNRYYEPNLGRYLSPDVGQTPNLYEYAGNSPIRFSDPLGLFKIESKMSGSIQGCVGVDLKVKTVEKCWKIIDFPGIGALTPDIHERITRDVYYRRPVPGGLPLEVHRETTVFSLPDFGLGTILDFGLGRIKGSLDVDTLAPADAIVNGVVAADVSHGMPPQFFNSLATPSLSNPVPFVYDLGNYDETFHFDNSDFDGGYSRTGRNPGSGLSPISTCQRSVEKCTTGLLCIRLEERTFDTQCIRTRVEDFQSQCKRTLFKRTWAGHLRAVGYTIEPCTKQKVVSYKVPCQTRLKLPVPYQCEVCWRESVIVPCSVSPYTTGLLLHPIEDFWAHSTGVEVAYRFGQDGCNDCGLHTGSFNGGNFCKATLAEELCKDVGYRKVNLCTLPRHPEAHCERNKDTQNNKHYRPVASFNPISMMHSLARNHATDDAKIALNEWCAQGAAPLCYGGIKELACDPLRVCSGGRYCCSGIRLPNGSFSSPFPRQPWQ